MADSLTLAAIMLVIYPGVPTIHSDIPSLHLLKVQGTTRVSSVTSHVLSSQYVVNNKTIDLKLVYAYHSIIVDNTMTYS